MDTQEKSLMVKCECSSESLEVQYWPEDKQFYVTSWQQGFIHRPFSWRERIKWMWHILKTGNPWGDMIILSPTKAKEISDFINKNL